MAHIPQVKIPATYLRGGTSKGVFFRLSDLPERCQQPGPARDAFFLRVIGSPDPYGAHMDGMGGATSSTAKCVILSKSQQPDHDVDYLYGQVAIDKAFVDWSGNCGNLSTGAGAFAIHAGLVDPSRIPEHGTCEVRIWQANIGKTILAHVPVTNGQVQETGDFELDGVTFPAAEIVLEFLDPSDEGEDGGALFPTGNLVDDLEVPASVVKSGVLKATLISAGIPTVFVNAEDIGYEGTELREAINGDPAVMRSAASSEALARSLAPRKHGELVLRLETAALRTRANAIIPPNLLFLAGGNASVRGYGYQQIGVKDAAGVTQPGRYLLAASLEYRRPVWRNGRATDWDSVVFVDAGSVSNTPSGLRHLKYGVGTGAIWRSPVGPVQLAVAYGAQERKVRLHMNLGFSF